MKRKILPLLLLSFFMVGCGENPTPVDPNKDKEPDVHEHEWDTSWSKSSTKHWHKCLGEDCNEKSDEADHTFGDWIIDTYATQSSTGGFPWGGGGGDTITDGTRHRVCSVCDYVENGTHQELEPEKPHEHSFATTWSSDSDYHWHACTVKIGSGWQQTNCNEVADKAAHTWDSGKITVQPTSFSKGEKTYTCTVCKATKTESLPMSQEDVPTGNFTITTDLSKTYEIHTSDQKKYLNLNIDYYKITANDLNSCNAKGSSEKSLPNSVSLAWNHTPASGKTLNNYAIQIGLKADLSGEETMLVKGTTSKSINLYNSFIGDNYFRVLAQYSDGSMDASEIKTLKIDSQAPRNLKIGSMSNCRDAGGRVTMTGATIKQGLLYRTAEPGNNPSSEVKRVLMEELGMKTEIYVKDGGGSSSTLGSSIKYVNASMDYGTGAYSNLSRNAERVRKVFDILADKSNYPVFYHCRIGTDRTGIVGILTNGVLGLSFQETIKDYCFSNFAPIDGQRYPNKYAANPSQDTNGDDIARYMDEILKMPGANFQEQCYNTLRCIGVTDEKIQAFMDIMLDGTKPTNNKGQIFNDASTFTLASGKSLSSNNDYTHPNKYAVVKATSDTITIKPTTEAKAYTVVVYLGNTSSSDSKKLSDGITVSIDGKAMTVPSTSYKLCGFGTTGQSRRTGYMINYIGKIDLTAGQHTLVLTGKSDTFNVGSIALIPGDVLPYQK